MTPTPSTPSGPRPALAVASILLAGLLPTACVSEPGAPGPNASPPGQVGRAHRIGQEAPVGWQDRAALERRRQDDDADRPAPPPVRRADPPAGAATAPPTTGPRAAPPAASQTAEPLELATRFTTTVANPGFSITDTRDGSKVTAANAAAKADSAGVTVQTELIPRRNGLDARFTLSNTTASPVPLGALTLGPIAMPAAIDWMNPRLAADFGPLKWPNTGSFNYPLSGYSPVLVARAPDFTIGASLLYSADLWDHAVDAALTSAPVASSIAPDKRAWQFRFSLPGTLPPGESRTYTIALRLVPANTPWIATLWPYRDFFTSRYGSVQYPRDPSPVAGRNAAFTEAIDAAANPRGFSGQRLRPDVNGFRPWAEQLRRAAPLGYPRVMFWNPAGLYARNQDLNFPFTFVSGIQSMPLASATASELASVSSPSLALGLWWGNSTRIMRGWDQPGAEPLDIDNPRHRDAAFAELDAAVALGARLIGLDAFTLPTPAAQRRWLADLQARAPGVRFITESNACDLTHLAAPTFLHFDQSPRPHLLADLLLPGHETWGMVTFESLKRPGKAPKDEDMQLALRRAAALGYTVVVFEPLRAFPDMTAAESWTRTIPAWLTRPEP